MFSSLQSQDHGQLLDVIDLLRSQGISHYVSLPQIIVCGDQSSGKSSVLEAISGVRFPTKDNLCTRFATELILRRGSATSAALEIRPGPGRSQDERKKLSEFLHPSVELDEFPSLVDAAKTAMGLDSNTAAFSDDVLRIEVTGPDKPHLTLVDLPGLIHSENKQQSAKDVELVTSLVQGYMGNERSIMLAVVSAKNDYANQIVTKMARDVDPEGKRTLGIITKPDTLDVGSENEKAFQHLAMNSDVQFRLGWHVLRNRDYSMRDCSESERDEKEKEFFLQGVWRTLPMSILGVSALKPRLSTVLKDQIVAELPSLIHDVEKELEDCQKRLAHLGESRVTSHEQRLYLLRISQSFTTLVKAASDGIYESDFFGSAETDAGFTKRLRAVVQDLHLQFAEQMRVEGHFQEIMDDPYQPTADSLRKISKSQYSKQVRELIKKTRGCELPGTFNPLIIGDLFYKQSGPWKEIVECFAGKILLATKDTLRLILVHVADEVTREGLQRTIINPALDSYGQQLTAKVAEILRPHQRGHPVTYNHYFTDTIQKARRDHVIKDQAERLNIYFALDAKHASTYIKPHQGFTTGHLIDALNPCDATEMDRFACEEAILCVQAYYKVAMKVMVDNFAVLGVENRLLEMLSHTLSPDIIMGLDDVIVQKIAAETEYSQNERSRLNKKFESLMSGLDTLKRLGQYQHFRLAYAAGKSQLENGSDVSNHVKLEEVSAVPSSAPPAMAEVSHHTPAFRRKQPLVRR